ncbi:CRTAC1 family protein, partial [Flavobacteriaceae bacterium]|nr:CRTAC1 family protein [Flavobacteriaceae bacterium]
EFANVSGEKAWSTGVTMADINGDGYLDIYVCNSGDVEGDNKQNELFINNGDLTFTESALEYNLNDKGFSTHANFFDYDKDGDLDVYILNNSFQAIGSFDLRRNERPKRDVLGGDKLMRNDNGYFMDVSESAGIYGSVIGFGLGITIGDIDGDNWDDIFISNDFFERDYLYINQKNGTFKEDLINRINSISGASMGADIADIDNNGTNDIFVTEMLPSDYQRLKSVTTFEGWDKYKYNVKNGYHHQFTRNVLHLNIENDKFSEIGRFSGVEASDWSWGALFFDFDNDGLKDLFVANGIYKDLTDQDYLQYISNKEVINSIVSKNKVDYKKLVEIIPSNPIPNQLFKNLDGLKFEKLNNSGLENPSFSNGSAYGDLDNDGDLDLVVNNVNMPVFIYENQTNKKTNYIKFKLIGEKNNIYSVGAKIYIESNGLKQMQQVQSARGFQSSVDLRPNFGIGKSNKIEAKIIWPSGKTINLSNVEPNQTIVLFEKDAVIEANKKTSVKDNIFRKVLLDSIVRHEENNFVDFNRDRLLFHMCSTEGPNLALGDINNSGSNTLFLSGSLGNYIKSFQVEKNNLIKVEKEVLREKLDFENSAIHLFDIDNDNDLDLYLGSGSVELSKYSEKLYDKIYINEGNGNFKLSTQKLPDVDHKISTGTVSFDDIDQDGDIDIFVGERLKINNYGLPASGFLLINDGKGNFSNQTLKISPELIEIGM